MTLSLPDRDFRGEVTAKGHLEISPGLSAGRRTVDESVSFRRH